MDPGTPFAAVDLAIMDRNIARLQAHLALLGVPLRLHVKTIKSIAAARRVHRNGPEPIAVSTLAEAEYFADHGYTDILYAVGIAPAKLERVVNLRNRGVDLAVLIDSVEQADAVGAASRRAAEPIPAYIEIDCDGHRGGVLPTDPKLIEIGQALVAAGGELRGVLDHAGESYYSYGKDEQRADAEQERASAVDAANALRAAGLTCPEVSIGSTPTAHATAALDGVTDVRAGVFVFFDLVMVGIGACEVGDIALSAVVTVIGRRPEKGWILTDGGWLATSRDRGTADQRVDQGYGAVMDIHGNLIPDLIMSGANQEHGVLSMRQGSPLPLPAFPVGTRLRVLPNHACAMAAQYSEYSVISDVANSAFPTGEAPEIAATWPRINGW